MLKKIFLIVSVAILFIVIVVPFLIPVRPIEGTVTPGQLADPDSKFIDINGQEIHYKERGEGEQAIILLHGFASSEFSWREVLEPLSAHSRVVAFDRPGFGLTERILNWQGESPYTSDYQADLVVRLMDKLGIQKAILIGNSAGGTIAMDTYLTYPDRINGLVLVDPAVYTGGGTPDFLRPLLHTPQMDRIGPLIVRNIQNWGRSFAESAWYDPTLITDEIWNGYSKPLMVENWDQALWQLTKASEASNLPEVLDQFDVPVLVITGEYDEIVPAEESIQLAGELPQANLVVIPNCGHVPQEECPAEFLQAAGKFLTEIQQREN